MDFNRFSIKDSEEMTVIKSKIVDRLYFLIMITAMPLLGLMMLRIPTTGLTYIFLMGAVAEIIIIAINVFRHKIPARIRFLLFIGLSLIISGASFSSYGVSSMGAIYLLTAITFAALFIGGYTAVFLYIVAFCIFCVAAYLNVNQLVGQTIDHSQFNKEMTTWVVQIGTMTFLSTFTILGISMIMRFLTEFMDYQKQQKLQIENLAYYDQLTQFPNRFYFGKMVQQQLQTIDRQVQNAALCLVDLCGFKNINDLRGHEVGDTLLCEISKHLSQFPNCVYTGRLDGDEFGLWIEFDKQKQETVLNDLITFLSNRFDSKTKVPVIFNGGIALILNEDTTYEELSRSADIALEEAKNKGEGEVAICSQALKDQLIRKNQMIACLGKALEKKELYFQLQPIIKGAKKQLRGFEVLMRWQSEDFGFIPPDVFIPLLEESGLINEVGNWILLAAAQYVHELNQKFNKQWIVAINLSAIQLMDPYFIRSVTTVLEESQIPPEHLELEITESIFIKDMESVIDILHQLKKLNIKISLDDFGTGYSSLSYLQKLPITTLKIDRSFISDFEYNRGNNDLVEAMINIAHIMHLEVVAEGIETQQQYQLLSDLYCDFYQGYYFQRPLNQDKLLDYINHIYGQDIKK